MKVVKSKLNESMFMWNVPDRKYPSKDKKLLISIGERRVVDVDGQVWTWEVTRNGLVWQYLYSIILPIRRTPAYKSRFNKWLKTL